MKKILLTASECVPFIKTGGLADVIGSLPEYFDREKFDVRVVIPKYLCIPEEYRSKMEYITHFYTYFNGRNRYVGIMKLVRNNITYYFIDNEEYFSGPTPYTDQLYDLEKFAFFAKAVLSILPSINFQPDIIHCNDWHTGLIPVYLRTEFAADLFYAPIKTIMTIHNLRFQGVWGIPDVERITGLPHYLFTPDKLESYKDANFLKGGIVYADAVTTVSETYKEEVKSPFYGEQMHSLLWARSNCFYGILNGIDYKEYDPATDKLIDQNFDAENFRREKKKNKAILQKETGLTEDPNIMMIGIVSRMTDQKGFDLIQRVFEELLEDDVQFMVLGTGEWNYEEMFKYFAGKYPQKLSANIFYSNKLSHRIYASCDAFLMPSLFEPCGLSQLMAMRYGTLPVVRETGGLKDTVEPYNEYINTGTGFTFRDYNAHEMMDTIRRAENLFYNNKRRWNQMVERAMKKDFSWDVSARKYEELYEDLTRTVAPEEPAKAPAEEPAAQAADTQDTAAPEQNTES